MHARRSSVASVLAFVILAAMAPSRAGDAAGLHDQWQPQTEHDARLQQPVRIEVLARAAVPALALLSAKTGVMLQVASQDLETVGDRKLTIIAQGCSLKSLMVQIPNALQECHWDIDTSGPQPAYLLHRNAGVEATMAELAQESKARTQEEQRPARETRLAEARAALAMSPEELDELMKTDPFLAIQVKDPEGRHRLELLLNLPEKDMEEFLATGRAYLTYATAPAAYQEAAQQAKETFLKNTTQSSHPVIQAWAKVISDVLPQAGICFEDYDEGGISFLLQCYDLSGRAGPKGDVLRSGGGIALPARFPDEMTATHWYRPDLLKNGFSEQAADAVLASIAKQRAEREQEKRDRKRVEEWREPSGPALHQIIVLPFDANVDKLEMQRFIAQETGLSLVSDYFTTWGSGRIPQEARGAAPVWQVLYLLGGSWFWSYDWNGAGDCLVFHDKLWHVYAPQEFPESMTLAYREKLKRQGGFTLEDVVEAALELARRRPVPPRQRGEWPWAFVNLPADLGEAGLPYRELRSEALLLYASLSAAQRQRARTAEGLPYAEMTALQQDLVRPYAFFTGGWNDDKHPIPDGEVPQAVFRVKQSRTTEGSQSWDRVALQIEFPSLLSETTLRLRVPKQP